MDTTKCVAQAFESQTHFHIPACNSALAHFSLQWRVVAMAFYDWSSHVTAAPLLWRYVFQYWILPTTNVTLTKLWVLVTFQFFFQSFMTDIVNVRIVHIIWIAWQTAQAWKKNCAILMRCHLVVFLYHCYMLLTYLKHVYFYMLNLIINWWHLTTHLLTTVIKGLANVHTPSEFLPVLKWTRDTEVGHDVSPWRIKLSVLIHIDLPHHTAI